VCGGLVAVGEEARGLDDDFSAGVAPRKVARFTLGVDRNRLAVNNDCTVSGFDLARERPVVGVVLEQVRERRGVGQIVDPDEVDVSAGFVSSAKNVTADTAKSIDSNFYRHLNGSPACRDRLFRGWGRTGENLSKRLHDYGGGDIRSESDRAGE
jgi:hypothetical protein